MPGKKNKTKTPAGNPGLTPETTSEGQTPDHTMSLNASSVAAGELPRQETQADEGDAAIKAFDDLCDMHDMTEGQTAKDPPPLQTEDLTRKIVSRRKTYSSSPNLRTSSPELPRTSRKR